MQNSSRFTEMMVMVVAVLGTGMVYLDQTALNVALPTIQDMFEADIGGLQWMVDIYILTLSTLLLIGGALGDRYGRVRVYVIGMIIFTAASVWCEMVNSLEMLIVARAVQGIGGALLVPGGLALINANIPPDRRGRMIGSWAMFSSLVIAFGPSLGGLLVDFASWRTVFLINLPLGILAIVVGWRYVPESRNPQSVGHQLDWLGVFTLTIGLGSLLFGLIEGPHLGWNNVWIITTLIVGVLGLIAFLMVEARVSNPIIPLGLFRNVSFSVTNLVTLIHWMSLSGIFFFLTLNLQQVQGYSALQAGLAVFPISVMIILLSNPMGRMIDRFGTTRPMMIGVGVTGLSFIYFAQFGIETNYWLSFFPATIIYGLGVGMTIVPVTTAAMTALSDEYSGIASGVNNTASRIANMLAIAIFGAIMVSVFGSILAQQLPALSLPADVETDLIANARNLGALQPPADLAPNLAEQTTQIIKLAFVDSFRLMMYLCTGLTVITLAILTWLWRVEG